MTRHPALRLMRRGWLWLSRLAMLTLAAGILLALGAALLLRYWVLPGIDQYRPQIEAALSRAANQRITVGAVAGEWDGIRPRLTLRAVRVFDRAGVERLALTEVDGTLSWITLLAGEPRFHLIELTGLSVEVRRSQAGGWVIAGMPLAMQGGDRGFGDWLQEQHRIVVRDSALVWIDETLGGTPLALTDVELEVERQFGAHRFDLRATPPLDVAAPVGLRGELQRPGPRASGSLHLQIGYADLVTLRQWLPLPVDAARGAGALEVWIDLEDGALRSVSAQVALSEVSLRLRPDLPPLELSRMSGRLGWAGNDRKIEIFASNLAFTTPDGLNLPPADLRYRRWGAAGDPATRSELRFDALDLAAVTRLVDRLPIDPGVQARLTEMNPRGTLRGFEVGWTGSWRGDYQASGAFERVSVAPSGYLPGFSSVSGQLQADQRGGSMSLRADQSELAMPRVFVEPLPLDSLAGTLAWSMQSDGPLLRVESLVFANQHLAGKVAGTYRAIAGQPGAVDLTGSLERADGREAWRYVPLTVNARVRDWLRQSIVSAQAREVQFRLRGDLARFPFPDGQSGLFEVITRFDGGTLAYAAGWPAIDGLRGELTFRNASMSVVADAAQVYGTRMASGRATIADLSVPDQVLEVHMETEGPTDDYLRFIEHSPADRMIGGFSRGMKAFGRGALVLGLQLPLKLKHMDRVRISGRYRFAANTLDPGHGVPPLEQLSGELLFSERDVSLREGSARILGLPARLVADRGGKGALVIRGEGRAEAAGLGQVFDHPAVATLGGAASWHSTLAIRDGGYDFVIASDLRGLSSSLPAPLAKDAASDLAFKLQRRSVNEHHELLVLTVGDVVSAQLLRSRAAPASVLRGEVRLNASAPAPERDGLWLAGRLNGLDLDRWRRLVREGASALPVSFSGLDLRVAELRAFGRAWHEVALKVSATAAQWQGSLASWEAAGTLFWTPAGPGALTGRFTRLHLPPAAPEIRAAQADGDGVAYPALDITAEDFRLGQSELGRLTLVATPENGEWRIRQLDLRSPEGAVSMKGVWQGFPAPLTRLEVKAEVNDIGRYFERLKLPQGIKGGSARVQGQLSWSGSPQAVDWPTLSGELQLQAKKGQFVKVEPGIGKLMGVVSLQALPRRVALDFRDVFSEGFAFDEISASAAITRGVARTQDFSMAGPSARVEMKGDINVAGETQRLDVKVVPSVSESVALGAAIVNPAVGIATLLAQKALKDPISAMVAFEYEVSGTWADPVVLKKKRESAQPQPQGRK